jgi:hypothetical protein
MMTTVVSEWMVLHGGAPVEAEKKEEKEKQNAGQATRLPHAVMMRKKEEMHQPSGRNVAEQAYLQCSPP